MPESERKLIQRIRGMAAGRGTSVVQGIGDDAAVLRLPSGHDVLVTTDFSIENVHFRRAWHPAEVVGWRCLTRGLSDITAMGGEPKAAFLSLAVSRDVPQRWVDGFLKGLLRLAKEFHVPLAGGDTAQSESGIQADIVVLGTVPKGKAVMRSGAKMGDRIYVTGALGCSAATLARLARSERPGAGGDSRSMWSKPRVKEGRWLRENGIPSAMIDISDGLSTDLQHICQESRVGAEIEAAMIPRARVERGEQEVGLDFALHGGDDYELLFTSARPVPRKVLGTPVTCIGRVTAGRGMRIVTPDGKKRVLKPRGWEHFTG